MKTEIKTFTYDNGEIQKVQLVHLDGFNRLDFFKPEYSEKSFDHLCDLYRSFFSNKYGFLIGQLVLFRLPQNQQFYTAENEEKEQFQDAGISLLRRFKKTIACRHHQLVFKDKKSEELFQYLQEQNCLQICQGKLDLVQFLYVGNCAGFISQSEEEAMVKTNSHFFIFNTVDCDSDYDVVGTPFGLAVKDGTVLQPPLFEREALLVNQNGKSVIRKVSLKECSVEIDGILYKHNENATFYERPENRTTPKGNYDLIIVNRQIVAVRPYGGSRIPCCGFVLSLKKPLKEIKDFRVAYHGFEEFAFAIQVGNSAIKESVKTEKFISSFHRLLDFVTPTYPPATYPMNYRKDRAPRMVLATDEKDKPVLLWLEGAGKFGYEIGKESCGASLSETADICQQLKLKNAVHLDGGGSAQILLNGQRSLKISDRDPQTFIEKERAVPLGIIVR